MLAPDGRALNVFSRVSGVDFAIEEAGGLAATRLGIRSLHTGTALATLNGGRGVQTVAGDDLRITTRSGATFDIDVDGVATVQELLARINAATGGAATADLAPNGNGLRLSDHTAGAGVLALTPLNNSTALTGLGLDVAASGAQIVGRDVNVQRVDSPFTGMIELHRALDGDDRAGIQRSAERIERVLEGLQRQQGQMASLARSMADRSERVENEMTAAQVLLSDVRDTDFTEAAVRFQQMQLALEASLTTAQKVMNLSLLDYLR
jgi:flagellin-like hook-associated protein FlgL